MRGSPRHTPGYFVWFRTPVGPHRQWWAELYYGERDHKKPDVLAVYPLTQDEAWLTLDELAARYPLPPQFEGVIDD